MLQSCPTLCNPAAARDCQIYQNLDLRLIAPDCEKIKFCFLNDLVSGILLWQSELTSLVGKKWLTLLEKKKIYIYIIYIYIYYIYKMNCRWIKILDGMIKRVN